MNFLLLEILACPIDKEHPLKLFIFSFDTPEDQIEQILSSVGDSKVINLSRKDRELFLKDKIITKLTPLEDYLNQIQSKIDLLEQVVNYSTNMASNKYIKKIKSDVQKRIAEFSSTHQISQIEKILPDLFLLNKFLLEIKINTGVLLCQKCNRWYPIFDAIPQLLPDGQRNVKEEIRRFANEIEKFNQFKKENNISI
jgi:uncharacterized protein YbaR (Trm112 family)